MKRAALALFLSLSLSGIARAQEDDAKKAQVLEEARQHVARAKVHYDLGEFKEAAEEYILVYRLRPIPALLFNIAQAYRQGGIYDKAKQFYKAYLRESPEVKNRALIEQNIREMDELLAKERRTREAPPSGVKEPAEATLPIKSGPAVAEAPKPAETPKPAEVKPVTPPKPPETHPVAAAPTSTVTPAPSKPPVTVAIGPTSPNPPSRRTTEAFTRTQPPPPSSKSHTLTWVAAAGSALALGGGAVFGYKTYDAGQSSDASKANILYGVGAALAIASATFFIFDF
jgi:tetratricopeptide (TPR) repeat protein